MELKPAAGAGGFPPFRGAHAAWTEHTLTAAVGRAVLDALRETGLIGRTGDVCVADRAGGYVRAFLESAEPRDSALFSKSLREVFGPLLRPRYVIPRSVERRAETILSRLLPSVIGRYFQRRQRVLAMLHAVPSALARNKRLVEIYQRHWNARVSPGAAVYAHQGRGEQMLAEARRDHLVPRTAVHDKEVFL